MNRLKNTIGAIYYSLPVQLFMLQVRFHKFILACWLFAFVTVTNNFGEALGIPYLFLEPEYLGEVSFFSAFLLGCGIGTFITSYSIAAFISSSYRFHFIALAYRPFFVFFLNNMLIPGLFILVYTICFVQFKIYIGGEFGWGDFGQLCGVYLGILMVTVFILLYFFGTNKNFVQVFGEKILQDLNSRRVIISKARASMGMRIRVDSYFKGFFRRVKTNPNEPADFRKQVRILNQNHGNALFLELILLLAIMGLGLLEAHPSFQVPAGMSIFLLLSVLLMMVAAFTFWFRKLGPLALVLILVVYVLFDNFNVIQNRYPALGMNYEISRAQYTPDRLYDIASEENIRTDILVTQVALNQWRSDYQLYNGPYAKPKAVILCVSGGGLRSAYFTTRILQKLDSLTDGRIIDQTRLITGASGGMIGAAYFRELYLRQKLGDPRPIHGMELARPMAHDLLNRVAMKMVTGLFLPSLKTRVGSSYYIADRGASFDQQLIDNLGVFGDRRIADYIDLEEQAVIPQMIFSPVIINDGRKLFISGISSTYLTRNFDYQGRLSPAITGIDFRRFFRKQDADSLLFVTALRMNASFPIITPYVRMPSDPPMQIIDAGVSDNYGLETASQYLHTFEDWYKLNADSVLILQIRDSKPASAEVPEYHSKNLIKQLLDPIGATYTAFSMSTDLKNEQHLHDIDRFLEGRMSYACFQYEPSDSGGIKASLSWHLTKKEVDGIELCLNNAYHQETFNYVRDWLKR